MNTPQGWTPGDPIGLGEPLAAEVARRQQAVRDRWRISTEEPADRDQEHADYRRDFLARWETISHTVSEDDRLFARRELLAEWYDKRPTHDLPWLVASWLFGSWQALMVSEFGTDAVFTAPAAAATGDLTNDEREWFAGFVARQLDVARCAHPGDHEHDHEMCRDAVAERDGQDQDEPDDDEADHCYHADRHDEDGEYNPDDDDCVHCECCCTCLGCEYGPRDGMLMFPEGAEL